jgi:hypothetical protein
LTTTLERLLTLRRRLAVALLLLGIPAYIFAFQLDPWVFGVLLLGLGPTQIAIASLGILARIVRRHKTGTTLEWVVDVLLLATAVAGFAFARTISWT